MTGRRRPHWRPFVLVLFLSLSLAPLPGATPSAAPSAAPAGTPAATTGRLEARVVLVAGDLSLKPVPKQRFLIRPVGDGQSPIPVLTGFDGILRQELPPGAYRIESTGPVELEGKRFSWDVEFQIRAGATTTLELSSDNARVETTAPATPVQGAQGSLVMSADAEKLANAVIRQLGAQLGPSVSLFGSRFTAPLGQLTGSVKSTTDGLSGKLSLAIK